MREGPRVAGPFSISVPPEGFEPPTYGTKYRGLTLVEDLENDVEEPAEEAPIEAIGELHDLAARRRRKQRAHAHAG